MSIEKQITDYLARSGRTSFSTIRFTFREQANTEEVRKILSNEDLFERFDAGDGVFEYACKNRQPAAKALRKRPPAAKKNGKPVGLDVAVIDALKAANGIEEALPPVEEEKTFRDLADKMQEVNPIEQLGDSFVALGEALKNPNSTISELVPLAHRCGLTIQFGAGV
ncbi:MAG: hypothetical protein PHQ40_15590 [Anaerolineaceae bacterium]|nr:hypothetical protein [Anaerolineaceae bacterium]